jgi:hypothetical protein
MPGRASATGSPSGLCRDGPRRADHARARRGAFAAKRIQVRADWHGNPPHGSLRRQAGGARMTSATIDDLIKPTRLDLCVFNPADWEGKKAPPRLWDVPNYVGLQLAVARAVAKEWIGLLPDPGARWSCPPKMTSMSCGDESRACCHSSKPAWRTLATSGLSILSAKILCSACSRKA